MILRFTRARVVASRLFCLWIATWTISKRRFLAYFILAIRGDCEQTGEEKSVEDNAVNRPLCLVFLPITGKGK